MTNLIFCGPDRSGKTTIIKTLCERLDLRYYKNGAEKHLYKASEGIDFATYCNVGVPLVISFLRQLEVYNIVMDRFTPCEFAYGHAFNRPVNDELIGWADDELAALNFKVIYCYKDVYNTATWDDDPEKLRHIEQIKYWYETYLTNTKMPVLRLETSDEQLQDQLNKIFAFVYPKV